MPTPQTTLAALSLVSPVFPSNTTTLSIDSSVLPIDALADANTSQIEVSIYNQTNVVSAYTTSSSGQHEFITSIPIIQTVSETTVQIIGRNYSPTAVWTSATAFALGYRYADPNGNVQVVVQANGNSGTLQPTWATSTPAKITSIQIASNVLTVTCANTLVPGQRAYLTNLTNATFLNGQIITVVTASPSQVTATYTHADYLPTADTGTANAITADGAILWANYGFIAITPTIKFTLLFFQSNLSVTIAPPSGIVAKKNQTDCTLQWVTPDYPGFIGVRVMISTDSAGINPPYTQFGDLVTAVSSTSQAVISEASTTQVNVPTAVITAVEVANNVLTITATNSFTQGTVVTLSGLTTATFLNGESVTINTATSTQFECIFTANNYTSMPDTGTATSTISTNIVTTTQTVMNVSYSSVDIPATYINAPQFYAMFSTVIQDPTTNIVYESVQNGPLLSGFVNLQLVSPTDFPVLQNKEGIAGRLIGQITRQQPDLDLSPRSEIRDIFVDPFSIEASNMSVREWFSRVSQSISGIAQIDDSTGTGVSTPFQSSTYKQQIARAYGLSPTDTQNLIDEQFNILGEQAGLTRLTATPSTVVLTFYTYQMPQTTITIPVGATVATASDSNTPAVTFTTTGQGVINIANISSFYNAQYGWWAVSVPAQCNTSGSVSNVGAGSIRQTVSNVPSGVNVTNLVAAQYGTDQESNDAFAARIQARLVTGVDTGTRHGYLVTALSTPGIIGAEIVAAGDLEMVRDWDAIRQKHVFGTVDIYARGTTLSQQDDIAFFEYESTGIYGDSPTYLTLTYQSGMRFQIDNFSSLSYPLYSSVEIIVNRAGSIFYLGTDRAQFDNSGGHITLNANDMAYQYVGTAVSYARVPLLINGTPATNQTALAALAGSTAGTYSFSMYARYESPFIQTPTLQPVLDIFSVTGQAAQTGVVNDSAITLVHTSDFLLNGGSNDAGDEVQVSIISQPTQKTITALTASPALIDIGMDVPLDSNGSPTGVLSVRSTDLSTLYVSGTDYKIVAYGPYHQYALQVLASSVLITQVSLASNVATVTAHNEFGVGAQVTLTGLINATFLNNQTVTVSTATSSQFTFNFTYPDYAAMADTGSATGSAIQNNQQVIVAYNKFLLREWPSFASQEVQVLNGTLPTTLDNDGFIKNTWLPVSYSIGNVTYPLAGTQATYLALVLDGWNGQYASDGSIDVAGSALATQVLSGSTVIGYTGLIGAQVPYASRYIKVTYNDGTADIVKTEGIDYTLSVDPVSGAATIARILTGTIPDGATVKVSYFYLEAFDFSTEYPAFVEILANELLTTKHAAADVLVKAMVPNPVDITMAVTLDANTSPEAVDSTIRTVIDIVLDNAQGTLYQSELISQVQAITGVQSVQLPLIKCAKSDGSYDIGVVVPTGTSWTKLSSDPSFASLSLPPNSWISTSQILPDSTLPSGGEATAIVDFLYQGQVFRRAMSVQDFLGSTSPAHIAANGTPGSFYIIGTNDQISTGVLLPSSYWQKVLLVVPQDVPNPGNLSFLVTYQVFNEGGAKDITVSSTEYLSPGRITINYITAAS